MCEARCSPTWVADSGEKLRFVSFYSVRNINRMCPHMASTLSSKWLLSVGCNTRLSACKFIGRIFSASAAVSCVKWKSLSMIMNAMRNIFK